MAVWSLLRETASRFSDHKASLLGAALAYYAVFSLGPLMVIAIAIAGAFNTIWDVVAAPSAGIWSIAKSYLASLVGVLALGLHAVDVTGAPRDSNRSQSAIEPVSVRSANSCRETVWRGQRPRRHF